MPKLQIKRNDKGYRLCVENEFCHLVIIPKGSFKREDGASLSLNSFYMSQFHVTQEFDRAASGNNSSYFTGVQHPVEQVSWYDAIRFCGILNKELNNNSELAFI